MIDVIILFFILGFVAGLIKSDLKLPPAIYDLLTIVLLLSIGIKGGTELASNPVFNVFHQIIVILVFGFGLPLVAFPILLKIGKLSRANAASVSAHYGSVSVGTFAVAIAFLSVRNIFYESHMTLFLVILELPAIISGIILAKGISRKTHWGSMLSEIFKGKSIVLLVGGLFIGWVAGMQGIAPISILFHDMFKSILALFLLEMGLLASSQISDLHKHALFLIAFGILFPIASACLGIAMGLFLGLSLGGTTLLAVMAASASYIAVPAAMRIAVPESSPTLSLTASLGITFPFNVIVGIPLYYYLAGLFFK